MSTSQTSSQSSATTDSNQVELLAPMPEYISLNKWEDSGFDWQGEASPATFERLATQLTKEHEQSKMQVKIKLYRRSNVLHLSFELLGEVWLTCQRCLQPVAIELTDNYDIALLDDESQIKLIIESQDYLLLDEVVIENTPERLLPLQKLIEDEILLKTPMAPKHDDCEMALDQFGEIPEEKESENPFAALAALKGKL